MQAGERKTIHEMDGWMRSRSSWMSPEVSRIDITSRDISQLLTSSRTVYLRSQCHIAMKYHNCCHDAPSTRQSLHVYVVIMKTNIL